MARFWVCLICSCVLCLQAIAIPALSRKYGIACSSCHVHGAKLNSFGQIFRQRGASIAGLEEKEKGQPITVWMSVVAANKASEPEHAHLFPSRLEVVSIGEGTGGSKYYVDWFPYSRALQADGTDVDRSGRFENLFVSAPISREFAFQLGQFRPLFAIDPNRRIAISEPFALSSALPGRIDSDARLQALRGFAPTMRSPAARVSWVRWDDPEMDLESWQVHISALLPGEFSIPTTSDGQRNASFEFEGRPKGYMLEAARQTTGWTISLFHFSGDNDRDATGFSGCVEKGPWHFESALWSGSGAGSSKRIRASADLCFSKEWARAFGLRFDKVECEEAGLVPYASFHMGGKVDAWRLAAEARLKKGTPTVFALEIHFLR